MSLHASFAALTLAGAGIFNLLCIDYALRPHLSSRLTLGDEPGPGNLGFTATRILIWFIATHVCILTNSRSTVLYSKASMHELRSPTKPKGRNPPESAASAYHFIANHFRRDIAR